MIHQSFSRRRAILAAAVSVGAYNVAFGLPAFPGAQGFGANAVGGRGGDVYHVTSLADTTTSNTALVPGTLRYGLYDKNIPLAGRTIVFDVGGVIPLIAALDVKNVHNVTIAGQTAPGGITLTGRTLQITGSSNKSTNDIVIRHIAVRGPSSDDAISIKGAGVTHDIILDHVSTSWGKDELLSTTQSVNNISVQNSFITESLNSASHAYGSLIRPFIDDSPYTEANVTYSGNLFANNKSRNPRPGSYSGKQLNFEFFNNVIYNWSDRAGYSGGSAEPETEHVRMNYINNYLVAGPNTPASAANIAFTEDGASAAIDLKVYQSGNKIDPNKNIVRDGTDTGWDMFNYSNGTSTSAFPVADELGAPIALSNPAYRSADEAYERTVAAGGASPWVRSAVDQRLAGNVKNGTGAVINTLPAEWSAVLATPQQNQPAGFDTDRDGMPNAWEAARGLNPASPATGAGSNENNAVGPNGYTNLENYLNYVTLQAKWNVDADANWGGILNWAGDRPELTDSTAIFGNVITAPRLVTLNNSTTVGQIGFDSTQGYGIVGAGVINVDVISGYAAIDVANGQHMIDVPLNLADDLRITIAPAASSLALMGGVNGAGKTLTKLGDGVLGARSLHTGGLNVSAGKVVLTPNALPATPAGTSVVNSLSVAAGAQLDVTNNAFIIDHSGTGPTLASVRQLLIDGKLASSLADGNHAVGFADNATLNIGSFGGETVDGTAMLIRLTRLGDANLDGTTNINDFASLAGHFGAAGYWQDGDFNNDGTINISDFALLAGNFGQSATAGSGNRAAVPEPTAAGLIAIGSTLLAGKRRRNRRA